MSQLIKRSLGLIGRRRHFMLKWAICLVLLLASTLANAQAYPTTWSWSRVDTTQYTTGTGTHNAWVPVKAAGNCLQAPIPDSSGNLWCINTGKNGVYESIYQSGVWTHVTSMGSGPFYGMAIAGSTIYSFQSTCNAGHRLYSWNGTGWTQTPSGLCGVLVVGAPDGTLIGVDSPSGTAGYIFYSTDGSASWHTIGTVAGTAGWTYGGLSDQYTMCGIQNGKLWYFDLYSSPVITDQFVQPSFTPTSCNITSDKTFLVTGSSGQVSMFNDTTSAWDAVVRGTIAFTNISARSKALIFGITSTGTPYHWNGAATPQLLARSNGIYNICPPGNCPAGVTHSTTLHVSATSGGLGTDLGSQNASASGPPYQYLDTQAWDDFEGCDPDFGDPLANGCQPTWSGNSHCTIVGPIGGPTAPPAVPKNNTYSTYYAYWDSHAGTGPPAGQGWTFVSGTLMPCCAHPWEVTVACILKPACQNGTDCTCNQNNLINTFMKETALGLTEEGAQATAVNRCMLYGTNVTGTKIESTFYSTGNPAIDVDTCKRTQVTRGVPEPFLCGDEPIH